MSPLFRFVACLLLVGVLAACGQVPKPFQHEGDNSANPLVRLDDAAGVAVFPLTGSGRYSGEILAAAVAASLRDAAIPASLGEANQTAKRLRGTMSVTDLPDGTSDIRILWLIRDADGAVLADIEQREQVPTAAWEQADAGIMAFIAGKSAATLAQDLRQDYGVVVQTVSRPAEVVLWSITGAPGDGNEALAQAMRRALATRDVEIYQDLTDSIPILMCEVTVVKAPPPPGSDLPAADQVTIAWVVLEADGTEIGRLEQTNLVERGRLDNKWGSIAFLAAQGSADALAEVLFNMANDQERLSKLGS